MSVIQPHFGLLVRKNGKFSNERPTSDDFLLENARANRDPIDNRPNPIPCRICGADIWRTGIPKNKDGTLKMKKKSGLPEDPEFSPGAGKGMFFCQTHKQRILHTFRAFNFKSAINPRFFSGVPDDEVNILVLKYMLYRYKREARQGNGVGNSVWKRALDESETFADFKSIIEKDMETWFDRYPDDETFRDAGGSSSSRFELSDQTKYETGAKGLGKHAKIFFRAPGGLGGQGLGKGFYGFDPTMDSTRGESSAGTFGDEEDEEEEEEDDEGSFPDPDTLPPPHYPPPSPSSSASESSQFQPFGAPAEAFASLRL